MITEEIKNLLAATPFIALVPPDDMVVFVSVNDVSQRIVGHESTHVTTKFETQLHL